MIKDIAHKVVNGQQPLAQQKKDDDAVLLELKQKLRQLNEKEKKISAQDDTDILRKTVNSQTFPKATTNSFGQPSSPSVVVEDAIKGKEPPIDTETFFQKKQSVIQEDPHIFLEDQKITNLVMNQIKELITINNSLTRQFTDMEARLLRSEKDTENLRNKINKYDERMLNIDTRLEKFLGLYEIVTNQFNPFVEQDQQQFRPTFSRQKDETMDNLAHHAKTTVEELQVKQHEENALTEHTAPITTTPTSAPEKKVKDDFYEKLIDGISEHIEKSLGMFEKKIENRIADSVDDTVRMRLHNTLEHLDEALEEEITHMIHRETKKIKEDHQKIHNILANIEQLIPSKPETLVREIDVLKRSIGDIEHDISKIKKAENSDSKILDKKKRVLKKNVPVGKGFKFSDGYELRNLEDFLDYLQSVDVSLFRLHVNAEKNDFADWIEYVFNWKKLADTMRHCQSPQEMIHAVDDFVKYYEY